MLEAGRRIREYIDRFAEELFPAFSTLDEPERAQRNANRTRRAPCSRECELLTRQRSCLFRPSELMQSECCL
jgi:hypothetical protein